MRYLWPRFLLLALVSVSASVSAAPTEEARTYFDNALAFIQEKHINSATADWALIQTEAEARLADAQTTADTYPAIRFVLAALGEKHSFLREPRPPARLPTGPEADAPQQTPLLPEWRLLDGDIGLVQLPQLDTLSGGMETGRQYAAELRLGLEALDTHQLCGWIVDLRENGGGNMWPMLQGLDPLLGNGPFGYFVSQRDAIVPWVRTPSGILPSPQPLLESTPSFSLVHQDAPVAVLIGPRTASSGEMAAIALIGRSGVRTFGAPSAGFTTANVPYPLSDGAYLIVTETTVRDRSAKDYKGALVPDEHVLDREAERAATEWLKRSC